MERLIFPITKKEAEKQGVKYSSQKNKEALFPSQLRELREIKGISQATLARDLGVSKSTIGLYETGDTLPDAKTLHDLAVYFGVSADYLLGLSDIKSVEGNEQSAASLGLPDNFIKYIMFLDTNLNADKNTLQMVISDNEFYEAISAITLIRTLLYKEDDIPEEYDFGALEDLRKKLFKLSNGTQSIVHSGLAVKSLLYSAEKLFASVAERCVSEFCIQQDCDYPLND